MNVPGHVSSRLLTAWILLSAIAWPSFGNASNPDPATNAVRLEVLSTADSGPGSLRSALARADEIRDRPVVIRFGSRTGPFSTPQKIELSQPLPPISGQVTIDGFIDDLLWTAYGVKISGGGKHRLFEVMPGGDLLVTGLTLSDGLGETGGAIVNRGRLVVESVSLLDNTAIEAGAAIANYGDAEVINSTLAWNRARIGGAIANLDGQLRMVHATLYDNMADEGAAVWSRSDLHVANSILAGKAPQQCLNNGAWDPESTHNLIQNRHLGCGTPLLSADPSIQALGHYNGPTPTLPIDGASPVLNLASSRAATGIDGQRLKWDQRGNGDPRFAAGFADLGAFEHQSQLASVFVVDTLVDSGLRGCTNARLGNCPLRAALELSAAARRPTPIRFSPAIFDKPTLVSLDRIPSGTNLPLVIDGEGIPELTISLPPTPRLAWQALHGVRFVFRNTEGGRENE